MAIDFHDSLFPTDISRGSKGGPGFNTDVIEISSGFESRNINWSQARSRYDVSYGVTTGEQLEKLIAFFRARYGRACGFKYKDWSDCRAENQVCPPAVFQPDPGHAYQCQKIYSSGIYNYTRPIICIEENIDQSNNIVYVDGTPVPGNWDYYEIYGPGIIYFYDPIDLGSIVTASFDFVVPVRFDIDKLSISLDNYNAAGTYFGETGVLLIEISLLNKDWL